MKVSTDLIRLIDDRLTSEDDGEGEAIAAALSLIKRLRKARTSLTAFVTGAIKNEVAQLRFDLERQQWELNASRMRALSVRAELASTSLALTLAKNDIESPTIEPAALKRKSMARSRKGAR